MSDIMIAANPTAAPTATPAKPAAPAPVQSKDVSAVQQKTAQRTEVKPQKPAAQQPSPGGQWLSMLPFIIIFVVMIFFMNRSQKKQMAKRQEMMDKIAKGTKVLLQSGIYGTVAEVREDSMIVEIADGVKIKVAKAGIAGIDAPEASGKAEGK